MIGPIAGGEKAMKLKVWLPTSVLLDETVTKIKAEAENGHFCLCRTTSIS